MADTNFIFFFFNDTATTEIYTLSLHDALPISPIKYEVEIHDPLSTPVPMPPSILSRRSEEHTSELQSRLHLVCRLLLEKKKQTPPYPPHSRFQCCAGHAFARHIAQYCDRCARL